MPKKKGRRHGNSSAKKKDTSEEHRTPELIEAMRAVEQTADFDMQACARECSEMQDKLTADYESIELNPSTPESRMADKVFDIAFDLKPDWLIKNTGSIESLKIYSKLPIDKNDPDFKDSKGQRLVDLTGNSWEDLSDMVEKECRDIMLEWLKIDNGFPMKLGTMWLQKDATLPVRVKQLLNKAMQARYDALEKKQDRYEYSSCPLHGWVPPIDLVMKVIRAISAAPTHRDVFIALFKGRGSSLSLLSILSYMSNCEQLFENLLLRADADSGDYETRHTDLEMGKWELLRINTIIYWALQQYAKVVSSVKWMYLYELHTHALAWKVHAEIIVQAAAGIVEKNQKLIKDQDAMRKAAEYFKQHDQELKLAAELTASQFKDLHHQIEDKQQETKDMQAEIKQLHMQVKTITAEYEQFKAAEAAAMTQVGNKPNLTTGECAICLNSFGTQNEIWASVPCGHTDVCKKCLDKHILPVQAMPAIFFFNCPSCQTKVTSTIRVFGVQREQQESLDA